MKKIGAILTLNQRKINDENYLNFAKRKVFEEIGNEFFKSGMFETNIFGFKGNEKIEVRLMVSTVEEIVNLVKSLNELSEDFPSMKSRIQRIINNLNQ